MNIRRVHARGDVTPLTQEPHTAGDAPGHCNVVKVANVGLFIGALGPARNPDLPRLGNSSDRRKQRPMPLPRLESAGQENDRRFTIDTK